VRRAAQRGAQTRFDIAAGRTLALVLLHGAVKVNGDAVVRSALFGLLSREGEGVLVQAEDDATLLLLSGEPIDEPIVGHGLFVMNTQAEIHQAMQDFNSGRFGQIAA